MALSFARLLCPSTRFGRCCKAKRVLREASHEVAREEARARDSSRYRRCGVVSRRGLEGPGGSGERGVWFIAHQCACFAVESRQLLALNGMPLVQTALVAQWVAGYLSTWGTYLNTWIPEQG